LRLGRGTKNARSLWARMVSQTEPVTGAETTLKGISWRSCTGGSATELSVTDVYALGPCQTSALSGVSGPIRLAVDLNHFLARANSGECRSNPLVVVYTSGTSIDAQRFVHGILKARQRHAWDQSDLFFLSPQSKSLHSTALLSRDSATCRSSVVTSSSYVARDIKRHRFAVSRRNTAIDPIKIQSIAISQVPREYYNLRHMKRSPLRRTTGMAQGHTVVVNGPADAYRTSFSLTANVAVGSLAPCRAALADVGWYPTYGHGRLLQQRRLAGDKERLASLPRCWG
jgi:hypothetical protein